MAQVIQPQQPAISKKARLWQGVVSHRPLRRHFEWWFQLMAIVSVPSLVACTIIIAAELSVPDLFIKGVGHMLANGAEIVLNAAIEAAMLGCIGLAKQAKHLENEPQARKMTGMGWTFAALTIITVGFQVFHASPDADKVLLLVRCAAGIVYCYVVHLDESTIEEVPTTNRQQQAQLDDLATRFNQQVQHLTVELSRMETSFHQSLRESSTGLESSFHQQLTAELSLVKENFQQYQEMLAFVPEMKAQLHQIESATREEVRQVKAALEQQGQHQGEEPQKRRERPTLRTLPTREQPSDNSRALRTREARQSTPQAIVEGKFDARAFVFSCLQENPDLKLAEIEKRALAQHQDLSQPTISRYRKQFFTRNESSSLVASESSTMQAESAFDESSPMKTESSSIDESMVAS